MAVPTSSSSPLIRLTVTGSTSEVSSIDVSLSASCSDSAGSSDSAGASGVCVCSVASSSAGGSWVSSAGSPPQAANSSAALDVKSNLLKVFIIKLSLFIV